MASIQSFCIPLCITQPSTSLCITTFFLLLYRNSETLFSLSPLSIYPNGISDTYLYMTESTFCLHITWPFPLSAKLTLKFSTSPSSFSLCLSHHHSHSQFTPSHNSWLPHTQETTPLIFTQKILPTASMYCSPCLVEYLEDDI